MALVLSETVGASRRGDCRVEGHYNRWAISLSYTVSAFARRLTRTTGLFSGDDYAQMRAFFADRPHLVADAVP